MIFWYHRKGNMKLVTDRPGRYFAILVFAPTLLIIARRIQEIHVYEALILKTLGVILFLYEVYWITRSDAEIV
jgi:hypothetical protein